MLRRVIRSIIFDLDGTLVHSLPGIAASLNRSLAAAGLPTHPETAVREFIGDGIKKLVERGAADASPALVAEIVEMVKTDYAKTWRDGTSPYPEVVDTLHTLAKHSIPCAVFSNKPEEYCREITDHIFPRIEFTAVRGQLEGVPAKPDPAGALAICKQIGIPPAETALVGDSTIDLETANNAGMITIAATWGYHDAPNLAALNPSHTIHSMAELQQLITT